MKGRTLGWAVAAALAGGGCGSLSDAMDSMRWQTPHDATLQTKELTQTLVEGQDSMLGGLGAVADGDKEKLGTITKSAAVAAKAKLDALDQRIATQETAWTELKTSVVNVAEGAATGGIGGMLNTVISGIRKRSDENARKAADADAAAKSADETARTKAKEAEEARAKLESRVTELDEKTRTALENLKTSLSADAEAQIARITKPELESLAALKADNAKFGERVTEILEAKGMSKADLDQFEKDTKGLSTEEILALVGVLIGGAAGGTIGGRQLSNSGKRLDSHKKELDELFDKNSELKDRLARVETTTNATSKGNAPH
jgi:hypothetical protein